MSSHRPPFLPQVLLPCLVSACIIIEGGDTGTASTTGPATATSTRGDPSSAGTAAASTTSTGTSAGTAAAADTGTAGGGSAACGWGSTGVPDPAMGYVCGGEGTDPSGTYPLACPSGLAVGAPCGAVTGVGCCDDGGNLWYCTTRGTLYQQVCG